MNLQDKTLIKVQVVDLPISDRFPKKLTDKTKIEEKIRATAKALFCLILAINRH